MFLLISMLLIFINHDWVLWLITLHKYCGWGKMVNFATKNVIIHFRIIILKCPP